MHLLLGQRRQRQHLLADLGSRPAHVALGGGAEQSTRDWEARAEFSSLTWTRSSSVVGPDACRTKASASLSPWGLTPLKMFWALPYQNRVWLNTALITFWVSMGSTLRTLCPFTFQSGSGS